jgi:hypothetical protein
MSLQKVPVHLNLTGGLQKKDDEYLVIPSKLAVANDVQFDDASTVVRRGGQAQLGLGAFNAIQLKRAFTHQGVAVLEQSTQLTKAGAGGLAQVLNPQTVDGFTPPRAGPRASAVTARVAGVAQRNSAIGIGVPNYDGSFDCASIGNVTCYVFETRNVALGTQTVRVVMIDDANNFRIYDTLLTDGVKVLVKPRVVASASTFYIFVGSFTSGGTSFAIKSLTLTPAGTATALSAAIFTSAVGGAVESAAGTEVLFDVDYRATNSMLGLVVREHGGAFTINFMNINTANGSTVIVSSTVVPTAQPRSLTALCTDSGNARIHAFYSINTNVAKAANYNVTTATPTAETTVGTGAVGSFVKRLAAYESSSALIYLAFDCAATGGTRIPFVPTLRLASFNHGYGALSECPSFVGWGIAGRIGVVNSRLYLPMLLASSFAYQSTTYVVDLSSALGNLGTAGAAGAAPHVVARIDYGESAIDITRWQPTLRVPSMPVRSNSLILPYLKFETDLRLVGGYSDTPFAVARAVIDFDSQLAHEEINGLTFLAGACPYIFDGSNYVEEGFHHGPEIVEDLVALAGNTGTYDLPTGVAATYIVCFTVAWQDAQGNWHESAPSSEMEITTTAANYSFTPTIIVPPSQKPGMQLLMYRTKGSSADTSLYIHTRSDGSQVSIDADLDGGEQIYTTGGVLPNTPAPACRHVSTFQKRLVLSGCGDGSRIHWSKVSAPGYGVEFSSGDPTHQQYIAADKGRVVGAEEQDNVLVVLCENACGVIAGSGPNALGTAGQYSDFSTIVSETGCSWNSPKSIIKGPEGVWFRSPFGIRLVSRSGGLALSPDGKQAGAEVDSLVNGTLIAVAGDAKQQLRFYQSSGSVLIWDYQWRQWTRFTNHGNIDAVYADDRYYHFSNYNTSTPLVRYTDETAYVDVNNSGVANTAFFGYIETPWLSLAGLQGFQRVYRLRVLGKNVDGSLDNQRFVYSFAYDFDETELLNGTVANVTPINVGNVQFEHHFEKQKSESLKIGLSFRPATGLTGRFRLTDLTLLVGVKGGYFKTPSSQRY